jgi:DNA-directed RNA polymerase specialized sigma24 family protein
MLEETTVVIEYVPFLRRYARALTGSQASGDEYVRACLEAMVAERRPIRCFNPRASLFRTFHEVWTALHVAMPEVPNRPSSGFEQPLERGLDALSALERQVLLLVTLEEFSYQDAAYILGITEAEVVYYLRRARESVVRHASASVLIIEDELLIAMDLTRIVEEMGHWVCGTAARTRDAVALAEQTNPALVLADIRLTGEDSGIEAMQRIRGNGRTPVVFVTGYPERVVVEDAADPTLVVSKPFEPEVLKMAVGQALARRPARAAAVA